MAFMINGEKCVALVISHYTVTNPSPGIAVVAPELGGTPFPLTFAGPIMISGASGIAYVASLIQWGLGSPSWGYNNNTVTIGGSLSAPTGWKYPNFNGHVLNVVFNYPGYESPRVSEEVCFLDFLAF